LSLKLRFEHHARTIVVSVLIGGVAGAASALFLALLDMVTRTRTATPWLLFALPVAGLVIGYAYQRLGESIRGGNDLVIDTIHDDGPEIPLRMAPIVLVGTLLTHLFGGSAGREGTAVQVSASLSDFLTHRLGMRGPARTELLAAGVAGGFGSVFGTPIAGTIFGLEFVVRGRIEYRALAPALVAALVGDLTTRSLGISHTNYPTVAALSLSPLVVAKWVVFACVIAAVAALFVELTHAIKRRSAGIVPSLPLRMCAGGCAVVALTQALGTHDYLGLGIPTIVRAFDDPSLPMAAFAWKLVFTAITVGSGFLGGEVTPLFFVGATLGNVLARTLGLPIPLGACVGLAAMFGCAANTPIALSIMAVELFGAHALPHVVLVSVISFLLAGGRSIYKAQRPARAESISPTTEVENVASRTDDD